MGRVYLKIGHGVGPVKQERMFVKQENEQKEPKKKESCLVYIFVSLHI